LQFFGPCSPIGSGTHGAMAPLRSVSPTFRSSLPFDDASPLRGAAPSAPSEARAVSPTFRSSLSFGPESGARPGATSWAAPPSLSPRSGERGRRHFLPRAAADPLQPEEGACQARRAPSGRQVASREPQGTPQTLSPRMTSPRMPSPNTASPRLSSPRLSGFAPPGLSRQAPHNSSSGFQSCSRFGDEIRSRTLSPRLALRHLDSSQMVDLLQNNPTTEENVSSQCAGKSDTQQARNMSSSWPFEHRLQWDLAGGEPGNGRSPRTRQSVHSALPRSTDVDDKEPRLSFRRFREAQIEVEVPLQLRAGLSARGAFSWLSARDMDIRSGPSTSARCLFSGMSPAELRSIGKDISSLRDVLFPCSAAPSPASAHSREVRVRGPPSRPLVARCAGLPGDAAHPGSAATSSASGPSQRRGAPWLAGRRQSERPAALHGSGGGAAPAATAAAAAGPWQVDHPGEGPAAAPSPAQVPNPVLVPGCGAAGLPADRAAHATVHRQASAPVVEQTAWPSVPEQPARRPRTLVVPPLGITASAGALGCQGAVVPPDDRPRSSCEDETATPLTAKCAEATKPVSTKQDAWQSHHAVAHALGARERRIEGRLGGA